MKSLYQFMKGKKSNNQAAQFDDDPLFNNRTSSGFESNQSLLVNDYLTSSGTATSGANNDDYDGNTITSNNLHGYRNNNGIGGASSNHYNHHQLNNDESNERQNGSTLRQRFINRKNNIFSKKLMKVLGNILAVVTLIGFLILVPWITVYAMIYDKAPKDSLAFYSAGAFVLITVAMSMKLIYDHLTNWYMPDIQKFVVRIIWMVPIYAVQSWLSLRFRTARIYIDTLRNLYEAYVIQSFLYYLMELLGGEDTLVRVLQDKDHHYGEHPPFPKWIFPTWEMGFEFMIKCKHGVLQYVVAKTLATLATAILEPIGLFNDGQFDWTKGYIYVSFIINLSQMWALYCLVKFYHATSHDLCHPVNWRPLGKFLCIKGVVFFTWWQGTLIAVLENNGLIGNIGNWNSDDVANGLQDYLICVEMFCFAIAHSFTFTHKEYIPNQRDGDEDYSLMNNENGRGSHGSFGALGDNNNDDAEDIGPPTIRTLDTPMGFRDAFWSSTVPNETIMDIKRTMSTGVSDQITNQSSEAGMLKVVSMTHAESI